MSINTIETDLKTLADAQLAFELEGWTKGRNVQKSIASNSHEWGTLYSKSGKTFYLNITSAPKAIQMLRRAF
jgi:hypothetical protein